MVTAGFKKCMSSPSIAVSSVVVDPKVDQELDDVVMSSTYGVVQGGDALVIGCAGILNLHGERVNQSHLFQLNSIK